MYLDKAKAYNETNRLQRQDAEDTLNEFASKIKWLPEGGDSVLHIGSRSGDVLFDYVFPLLPKNFARLVGIDKSEEMISYAMENYRHPKLSFERADIINADNVNKLLNQFGQFDHVTTLCSLHWVMDQEIAFKNIFNLLAPHGDILITMCENHPLYEHYRDMMALDKWSDYREQMKLSTSPYFGVSDPVKMLKEILEKSGFENVHVELKERMVRYEKHIFIDTTSPNTPILRDLPERLRREFVSVYEDKIMQMSQNMDKTQHNRNVTIPYRMLIAYAEKGNNPQTHNIDGVPFKNDEVQMHNAKSYHDTNCMQRKDALDTIMEYQRFFQWTPKGDDYVLEIGIGCGDITYDFILPIIPKATQILATDKSQEMLDYASLNFSHPRISFDILDIESEIDTSEVLRKYGQFQRIASFFALHWPRNQSLVMRNIFRLLQPGGEVLMTILQSHPVFEHDADMSEIPKWSPYRLDIIRPLSPYFRNENPEKELYTRIEQAGLVDINVVLKEHFIQWNDNQALMDSMVPVSPFLDKVSPSLKQEFLQIFNDRIMKMSLPAPYKSNEERNDGKILISYFMLIAYAKKPSTNYAHC